MRSQAHRIGLIALAAFPGCKSHDNTILVVRVSLAPSVSGMTSGALRTTVKAESGRESSAEFRNPDGSSLRFPTSFTLELPRTIVGPLRLEVVAHDVAGGVLARSVDDRLEIRVGQKNDVEVTLGCEPGDCASDGGRPDGPMATGFGDGGPPPDVAAGRCGNGILDDGELCDPGIPLTRRGACPPASCDDGRSCTRDVAVGSGCRLSCQYEEVQTAQAGDGCCPAQASAATDSDCSSTCGNGSLEPGETCDPALPPGHANTCPTPESCDDQDSCTRDDLVSAGTCAAACVRRPILAAAPGDGCCPLGASSGTDTDCPVVCGNGRYEEAGGETCDPALPASDRRRCSEACPDDGDLCTTEVLVGAGCQTECRHIPIERSIPGDGCCLPGVGRAFDTDCPAVCGNARVEPGEFCDKAIAAGTPGACPTTCSEPGARSCVTVRLDGSAETCTARCIRDVTLLCGQVSDGCCPQGCAPGSDPDCSPTCGDGEVDRLRETCDTGIPSGIGVCPRPADCTDGNPCTTDQLISPGTCSARCVFLPVSIFEIDGCCPPDGNALVDMDCPAVCGNNIVENLTDPREFCDRGLPVDSPGGCLVGCPTASPACVRGTPRGSVGLCTARCLFVTISTCQHGDGCCPSGCMSAADDDCPAICGNGTVESDESCDRGIPAGNPGACRYTCDDDNACTFDSTLGRTSDCTRSCQHTPIRACLSSDRCCPEGCSEENDSDCKPPECGNRVIEAGETCDPPSSCPAECVDDGDPCTLASLLGDAKGCSAACVHMPITVCSGATADRCCPLGCLPGTDQDCGAPPPNPTPF